MNINNYVNLSIDLTNYKNYKKASLEYIKKYHIITDATLGILEENEHGFDQNGKDALLSLCEYIKDHGVNVNLEDIKDDKYHNAPGIFVADGYGAIYFIYDKDAFNDDLFKATKVAIQIAIAWDNKFLR